MLETANGTTYSDRTLRRLCRPSSPPRYHRLLSPLSDVTIGVSMIAPFYCSLVFFPYNCVERCALHGRYVQSTRPSARVMTTHIIPTRRALFFSRQPSGQQHIVSTSRPLRRKHMTTIAMNTLLSTLEKDVRHGAASAAGSCVLDLHVSRTNSNAFDT